MCVDMGGGGSHFRERGVHRGFTIRGFTRGSRKGGVHVNFYVYFFANASFFA